MEAPKLITGHHHVTSCVGGAQEDHDFHTKVLGLHSVKKTLLYDGRLPIYHLYYGNEKGQESTLLTTFPVAHTGLKAHHGTGQFSSHDLSIPESAVDYWQKRLNDHGIDTVRSERFGEMRLTFSHPGGIRYALVTVADDDRGPCTNHDVPPEMGIRGSHGITLPLRELEQQEFFMAMAWGARKVGTDGAFHRWEMGQGGTGTYVDLEVLPDVKAGTWNFGQGMVHHCAFGVGSLEEQATVKAHIEGLGFTDVSDSKDRGYFHSIYVRSPAGALFEATVSKPEGFLIDEPADQLGRSVMLSPQFEDQRAEIMAQLETIED
ncbi:MAG: glyoxalase [Sandaracinaceae bacterium]